MEGLEAVDLNSMAPELGIAEAGTRRERIRARERQCRTGISCLWQD